MASELKKRWTRDYDAQVKSGQVISSIQKHRQEIPVEKIDGLYDLRGLVITGSIEKPLVFKKAKLERSEEHTSELQSPI